MQSPADQLSPPNSIWQHQQTHGQTINFATNSSDQTPEQIGIYSTVEAITQQHFRNASTEQLPLIAAAIEALAKNFAKNLSRRCQAGKKHWDMRRSIRSNMTYGEILYPQYKKQRRNRLRLVALCDESGSMKIYSYFFLQLLYSLQQRYRQVSSFVFSTALYSITPIMQRKTFSEMLETMENTTIGWSGGTKIGDCIGEFTKRYPELISPQTVCIIVSDGWDSGESERLKTSMQRLARCHCTIWLNPWLASNNYEPTCRGMQAALPYIDIFAPVHNVQSLQKFTQQLLSY